MEIKAKIKEFQELGQLKNGFQWILREKDDHNVETDSDNQIQEQEEQDDFFIE
jgi:hypothetical protein